MKIKEVTKDDIVFDNGNVITHDHEQDCCEHNYADFEELQEDAKDYEFDEDLIFEKVTGGFRFGSKNTPMFFIPCYSDQNGFYGFDVDIYYNDKKVLTTYA